MGVSSATTSVLRIIVCRVLYKEKIMLITLFDGHSSKLENLLEVYEIKATLRAFAILVFKLIYDVTLKYKIHEASKK
jgi:hypothetical protein